MRETRADTALEALYRSAPSMSFQPDERIAVVSDLHLGDGSTRDDFLPNSELFLHILKGYYLRNGFTLILNGDIEELLKFPIKRITERWETLYEVFRVFFERNRFYKVVGNHDFDLILMSDEERGFPCSRALVLRYGKHSIFLFHGHQVSYFYERYNIVSSLFNRYVSYPLNIKNFSVAHDSAKKFKIEKRVYNFSSGKKIVSIIGHTHRPLFESLSKIDSHRFRIESLCRDYVGASETDKPGIESEILYYRKELDRLYARKGSGGRHGSLYNSRALVPCLFNSGCAIGKRGITSIEITGGEIGLVHWFDGNRSRKYIDHHDNAPRRMEGTDFYRMVVKKEPLDYIFTRIRLLS